MIDGYAGTVTYEDMDDEKQYLPIDIREFFSFKVDDVDKMKDDVQNRQDKVHRSLSDKFFGHTEQSEKRVGERYGKRKNDGTDCKT